MCSALQVTPEICMAQAFMAVHGCDGLDDKFLRAKFDALDMRGQDRLYKENFCNLFHSPCLTMSHAERDRAINDMPNCGMSFGEFKSALLQTMEFDVAVALDRASMVHRSGDMILMNARGMPADFDTFLYSAEKTAGLEGKIKYVICEENSGRTNLWHVHAVTKQGSTKAARLPFPKSWQGRKGTDLAKANCGVPGSVSVSRDGCTAISTSKEGAISLAARSLSALQNRDN